jgi:hypothetical protein
VTTPLPNLDSRESIRRCALLNATSYAAGALFDRCRTTDTENWRPADLAALEALAALVPAGREDALGT